MGKAKTNLAKPHKQGLANGMKLVFATRALDQLVSQPGTNVLRSIWLRGEIEGEIRLKR